MAWPRSRPAHCPRPLLTTPISPFELACLPDGQGRAGFFFRLPTLHLFDACQPITPASPIHHSALPRLRFLRFSRFLRLKIFSVGFFAPKSATEKPQKRQFPHRGNCPERSRRANAASPETRSCPLLTPRAKQKSVWKSLALRGRPIGYNPFSMSSPSPRRVLFFAAAAMAIGPALGILAMLPLSRASTLTLPSIPETAGSAQPA